MLKTAQHTRGWTERWWVWRRARALQAYQVACTITEYAEVPPDAQMAYEAARRARDLSEIRATVRELRWHIDDLVRWPYI